MDAYLLRYARQPTRLPSKVGGEYRWTLDANHTKAKVLFRPRLCQTWGYTHRGIVVVSHIWQQFRQFLHQTAKCLSNEFLCHLPRPIHRFQCQSGLSLQSHTLRPRVAMPRRLVWHRDGYVRQSCGCPTIPPWRTNRGR